jgi:uncharacterized protein (DUF2267 family)
MAINQNELAVRIAEREGLRQSVNIAQIKEILRITIDLLSEESEEDVLSLLRAR